MSDFISRAEAIEAIASRDETDGTVKVFTGREVNEILSALPSAEPKTGKCKDCTHWDKLDYEAPRQGWCYQFEEFTDADEYCSRCAMMRGESHE